MEPLFMAATHPVGDGLRQAVRFRPDNLGAEDQAEVVDAPDGVTPRHPHQRLRTEPRHDVPPCRVTLAP